MARLRGGYKGARSCTSGPQPGAWGAMDYFLGNYRKHGGVNSGIYNCRSVRGGRTTSLHGEGRAADFGIRPYSAGYGTKLANALVNMSKELGIQCVIWNRKIWSSSYPDRWRTYTGVAHHRDHIHVEFTWSSAKRSRKAQAKRFADILGGNVSVSAGDSGTYRKVGYGALLKVGVKGDPVKDVQRVVGVKVDGFYGAGTADAVGKFQSRAGLKVDKIVGPKTWNALKADPKFQPEKKATKPKPKGKVPGPGTPFPLPKGHYFGPKSGGDKSVSGFHSRKFNGIFDRSWLIRFAEQLGRRGWSVGKGKSYLKSGIDGKYGPEYEALIKAFQKDQGLRADGLLGKNTWDAAYQNPIK